PVEALKIFNNGLDFCFAFWQTRGMTKPKVAPEGDYLTKVGVRLITEEERERFDGLLESQHYLHSARVGGQIVQIVLALQQAIEALALLLSDQPHAHLG